MSNQDNLISFVYPSFECHSQHHFLEGLLADFKIHHSLDLEIINNVDTFQARDESDEVVYDSFPTFFFTT